MPSASLSPLRSGGGQGGQGGHSQRYPTPFLDISSYYVPRTVKSLFRWCRLYMYSNPIVAGVVRKKSQYPLTALRYKHSDKELKRIWKKMFEEHLRLRSHLFEMSLDVQTYGNAFGSIYFPMMRFLVCPGCKAHERIEKAKFEWKDFHFRGKCKACAFEGNFKVRDVEYRYKNVDAACNIRLVRWPVDQMEIDYIHISGEHIYRYSIPPDLRRRIIKGHVETLARYPLEFFEAVRSRTNKVKFQKGRVFHWKRPGISAEDMAWGEPAIISVLKTLFVTQLFVKAREQIAHQHVVPLWVLFPQPIGNTDPFKGLDLSDWRHRVEAEIGRWIQNPNYIPIMPIPLGSQFIGGNANRLNVINDIKQLESDMLVGLMVPPEFAYSGSWSGSSIAIRLLENEFIHTQEDQAAYVNRFLTPRIARHTGWAPIEVGFSDLRLQDDVQRQNFHLSLVERGMLSKESLVHGVNESYEDQLDIIRHERELEEEMQTEATKGAAKSQGEGGLVSLKYQIRSQLMQQHYAKQVVTELTAEGYDPNEIELIHQQIMGGGGYNVGQDLSFLGDSAQQSPESKRQDSPRYKGKDEKYEHYAMPNFGDHLQNWAQQLLSVPHGEMEKGLTAIQQQAPLLHKVLIENMRRALAGQSNSNGNGSGSSRVDMRPLPQQKPPRRQT